MTIDQLARAMQREFMAIRGELNGMRDGMATKSDLQQTENRLMKEILETREDIDRLTSWIKDIDGDVALLKKKVG